MLAKEGALDTDGMVQGVGDMLAKGEVPMATAGDGMVQGRPVGPAAPQPPTTGEDVLARLIDAWEPSATPACHSCTGARVLRDPDGVVVARCNHAGAEMPLARLLRGRYGRGFRPARTCPDWEPS